MSYQRFIIRQLQLERICRKYLYLFFDALCVLFTSNDPNQKIISVADILQPLKMGVKWVGVRQSQLLPVQFTDFCRQFTFLIICTRIAESFRQYTAFFLQLIGCRKSCAFCAFIKLPFQLRHIPVQFVQIDVGENRADNTTLRRSAVCVVVLPFFQISRFKEFAY